ncbi:DNA-binding protein [uncultured Methylobacterium sp.]|uniref:DNA-binding protein n=1 Tax=uncultured Methylobacterium sp. TaxID=157278 RepID=UPI0035CB2633
MLRSRVRRSFTVEIKSKSRQTPSWPEATAPQPVNWAALDPAPEAPASSGAEAAAPPAPAEKPRRILPSLIVAESEPEAPEPVAARERPLPRVRRATSQQVRAETSRTAPSWSLADLHEDLVPQAAQAQRQAAPQPVSLAPAAAPARNAVKPRTSGPALRPGERWKRRLPRACW